MGADRVAEQAAAHYAFFRIAVADPLMELTMRAFGLTRD